MGEFSEAVFRAVSLIPRGCVATYGQIARLIGHPRSARYVGYALRNNPSPGAGKADIPCHRVVFADGRICEGYQFGGPDVQRQLLQNEGVTFVDDAHVDLEACQWSGFDATKPLAHCKNADGEAETGANSDANATIADGSLPPDAPTAPPTDFDWRAELGED